MSCLSRPTSRCVFIVSGIDPGRVDTAKANPSQMNYWHSRALFKLPRAIALAIGFMLCEDFSLAAEQRLNVVFILTDNHGAWTLGCYGNQEIRTPNIDKLASEGMLFTRAYCNNSVCSP